MLYFLTKDTNVNSPAFKPRVQLNSRIRHFEVNEQI